MLEVVREWRDVRREKGVKVPVLSEHNGGTNVKRLKPTGVKLSN